MPASGERSRCPAFFSTYFDNFYLTCLRENSRNNMSGPKGYFVVKCLVNCLSLIELHSRLGC